MKKFKGKDAGAKPQVRAGESQTEGLKDVDRRKAMKKLGKYAAYTAPAMLALLLPRKSLAYSDRP
jgi:hypothetical protein